MNKRRSDAGFTLIELFTTLALIGILASLSFITIGQFRARASEAVARQTLHDSRNALEAAIIESDSNLVSFVSLSQATPGSISDPELAELLPGFMMPAKVKVSVLYNPNCNSSGCTKESLQVNHCDGLLASLWERYGDGEEFLVDSLPSAGCA